MRNLFRFNRLLVFFLSTGLFVLGFEILLQHYAGLSEKAVMWTPIIFGFIGGFIGLVITLVFNKFCYYLFFLLMTGSIVVGLMGIYFHNVWRFPLITGFLFSGKSLAFETLTSNPPLLAPSALIAIGVLGFLINIYFPWGDKN